MKKASQETTLKLLTFLRGDGTNPSLYPSLLVIKTVSATEHQFYSCYVGDEKQSTFFFASTN